MVPSNAGVFCPLEVLTSERLGLRSPINSDLSLHIMHVAQLSTQKNIPSESHVERTDSSTFSAKKAYLSLLIALVNKALLLFFEAYLLLFFFRFFVVLQKNLLNLLNLLNLRRYLLNRLRIKTYNNLLYPQITGHKKVNTTAINASVSNNKPSGGLIRRCAIYSYGTFNLKGSS